MSQSGVQKGMEYDGLSSEITAVVAFIEKILNVSSAMRWLCQRNVH